MALHILAALAAGLGAAGTVVVSWWLGVWGALATLAARVKVLEGKEHLAAADVLARLAAAEVAIDGLKSRWSREDGRAGRAKQRERSEAEAANLAEVLPAAMAELATLPAKKGGPRLAPPAADGPDVLGEAK